VNFAAEFFRFATAAFTFKELFLGCSGAAGALTTGLRSCGEASSEAFCFLLFEQIEQTGQCKMAVSELRTAVGSGDCKAGGQVTDRGCRADLVDVLPAGACRS
jgi:hypothetical protein